MDRTHCRKLYTGTSRQCHSDAMPMDFGPISFLDIERRTSSSVGTSRQCHNHLNQCSAEYRWTNNAYSDVRGHIRESDWNLS